MNTYLCIDIGNTSTSFATYHNYFYAKLGQIKTDQIETATAGLLQQMASTPYKIGIASVARDACLKLTGILKTVYPKATIIYVDQNNTNLNIPEDYPPTSLGNDRIAAATGGVHLFPDRDLIIIDFGTATTISAIDAHKNYLGGTIMPGFKTSQNSLATNAPALKSMINQADFENAPLIGDNTINSLASGIFYGHIGAIKEIQKNMIKASRFNNPIIIGTGGYASTFAECGLYNHHIDHLIQHGIHQVLLTNHHRE